MESAIASWSAQLGSGRGGVFQDPASMRHQSLVRWAMLRLRQPLDEVEELYRSLMSAYRQAQEKVACCDALPRYSSGATIFDPCPRQGASG
jgi:hypothetical protein